MKILNNSKTNNSEDINELSNGRIILSYLIGFIMILFLIWAYKENQKTENIISENGEITKGVVLKIVNRTRGTDFQYRFETKHTIITSWGNTYKYIGLGDTIPILYYPKNPHYNKPIIGNE